MCLSCAPRRQDMGHGPRSTLSGIQLYLANHTCPPVSFHRDTSLVVSTGGEPGHTQTHETHTGHAGAQGHSTGLYMCPVCVPAPPVTGTCLFTGTGTGTGVSWFPCVSRLPPVFTRYRYRSVLFTGTCTVLYRLSRLPPVSFYRYRVPVVSFYR